MSKQHQKLKRIRYYRGSKSWQDMAAKNCGLELCNFLTDCQNDCDFCYPTKPGLRFWVQVFRGEVVETDHSVCSDCLPQYYKDQMSLILHCGDRGDKRWWRHQWLYGRYGTLVKD